MTLMTACTASVGWDPMNAQLTFPLSSQFSPYKAQLNKMLKMHFFSGEVMQKLNSTCYTPNAQ